MDLRTTLTRFSRIIVFGALILLAPTLSGAGSYPLATTEETPQGNFLSGFSLVPGSVTLIEEQYVLALFKNTEDDLYAAVLFNLNCASDRCDVGDVIAYSLFDSQGVEKQLVKESYGNGVSTWSMSLLEHLTVPL
jgi:hypothetical protein